MALAQTYIYDAADRIHRAGRIAINAFAEGDEKRMMLMGLKRFTKVEELNTVALRKTIADQLISGNRYSF
jgi:hypothetical protein